MNGRLPCALIGAASLLFGAAAAVVHAQAPPTFRIDWHVLSAGGAALRNTCVRVNGTVAQTAPGYSSGGIYALLSGYWSAASPTVIDTVFFNGFEECHP